MMFMNEFLEGNKYRMFECLEALAQRDTIASANSSYHPSSVNDKMKNEALITITKCIYDHLQAITYELESTGQVIL